MRRRFEGRGHDAQDPKGPHGGPIRVGQEVEEAEDVEEAGDDAGGVADEAGRVVVWWVGG